jgi:drug/metabolite transporter (DMT)-like permease
VIGLIGGLITALTWAGAGTCSARCARAFGPLPTLALGNLIGACVLIPIALVWEGPPPAGSAADWLRLAGFTFGTIGGLGVVFRAYRSAKVGLVSATVSTSGALAALGSVLLLGERVKPLGAVAILAAGLGVAVVAWRGAAMRGASPRSGRFGVALALLGAGMFAESVLSASHISTLPAIWVVAAARAAGAVAITGPVAARGGLPRPRGRMIGYALGSPLFDAVGFVALLIASRHGVALPAVLSTLNVVITALLGVAVFSERLTRVQWIGVAVTLVAAATLASVR